MTGRSPKLDGRKANEGGRALQFETAAGDELKAPTGLGYWGRHAWAAALRSLRPARVLAHGDLLMLEAGCRAWGRWKDMEEQIRKMERAKAGSGEFDVTPNKHRQISARRIAADRALKVWGETARQFGMTPVARIKTAGTAQGDLFGDLESPRDQSAPDPTDPFGDGVGRMN